MPAAKSDAFKTAGTAARPPEKNNKAMVMRGFHLQRSFSVPRPASAHMREMIQKRRTTLVSGQPAF